MGLFSKVFNEKSRHTLSDLLSGAEGRRMQLGSGLVIAAEVAAVGIGITTAVGALPITGLISSGALAFAGIKFAFTLANQLNQRRTSKKTQEALVKANKTIAEQGIALKEQGTALKEMMEMEREILDKQPAPPKTKQAPQITAKALTPG